ncbi:MAG: phenylalanine--tRNA ligase subunit beta [Acidimicrobiales bacterium]
MKVLLSWLQEFAPGIDGDIDELGDTLSALGLAVEETSVTGGDLEGIVLARVVGLAPHPDADKIQLVQVDQGDGEALQVCCGAFNMVVGDLIPFATIGTIMPNGMEIGQRKMRGQMSNGMCCSSAELGLGDDEDGIMILTDRVADAAVGTPITEALGIERDVLWDLDVNANRPDAMSVAGVARDLAAALGVPFSYPDWSGSTSGDPAEGQAEVEIVDPSLCGRFAARVIHGVSVGTSPQWIQNRLIALGMRPINSVVDISNYVMLELGQPNHTYDLDLVADGHIRVRRADEGETLTTLDGIDRTLVASDGVIANGADDAIGIAGVMGGESTEIGETTTSVLLEMAWWDPPSISRTIKRLNLASEASTRFRRGADWGDNIDRAMDRFCQLIAESGATVAPGQLDERGALPNIGPLPARVERVNSLLGTDLDRTSMTNHLTAIGFEVAGSGDVLDITVPTWRWDTTTDNTYEFEANIAEEVGRMFGYENIPTRVPKGEQAGHLSDYQLDRRLVRSALVGAGCDETHPMPFLAPGDLTAVGLDDDGVRLTNPLDANESVLRATLLPGQLKAIAYNQSHRNPPVRFFEVGDVFLSPAEGSVLPDEREFVAVALSGEEAPAAVAILELLGEVLALPNVQLRTNDSLPGMHPTRSAEVVIAGRPRGVVGEIAPSVLSSFDVEGRVAWLELDLGAVLSGPHGKRSYTRVSKFPSSDMDLAFVIPDNVGADRVRGTITKAAGALLASVELIDTYRGTGVPDGSRSLTYSLRLQADDRTLTDDDITAARSAVIAAVEKTNGGTLRG